MSDLENGLLKKIKEYIIKGFTIDDERPKKLGGGIIHDMAIEKAKMEYRKYQVKELISIEKEYLKSINYINKISNEVKKEL